MHSFHHFILLKYFWAAVLLSSTFMVWKWGFRGFGTHLSVALALVLLVFNAYLGARTWADLHRQNEVYLKRQTVSSYTVRICASSLLNEFRFSATFPDRALPCRLTEGVRPVPCGSRGIRASRKRGMQRRNERSALWNMRHAILRCTRKQPLMPFFAQSARQLMLIQRRSFRICIVVDLLLYACSRPLCLIAFLLQNFHIARKPSHF